MCSIYAGAAQAYISTRNGVTKYIHGIVEKFISNNQEGLSHRSITPSLSLIYRSFNKKNVPLCVTYFSSTSSEFYMPYTQGFSHSHFLRIRLARSKFASSQVPLFAWKDSRDDDSMTSNTLNFCKIRGNRCYLSYINTILTSIKQHNLPCLTRTPLVSISNLVRYTARKK